MKPSRPADRGVPTPLDLAAYGDGQLDPARQQHVESWLRDHPEAAAEIDGQRRVAQLWQATTPAEPEEVNWPSILARVECAVRLGSARRRHWRFLPLGAAGLVAALLLLLSPLLHKGTEPLRLEEPVPAAEPLAVVSPEEVEIVSLHAADRETLVVGVPPVEGPLVLASVGDVQFDGVEPATDGMVPHIYMDERSATPMIVAPLDPPPQ